MTANKPDLDADDRRPRILIVGPGPTQVGGVSTFINILLASPILTDKYKLIHLDTTRGPRGAGLASRFALINIFYLIRQLLLFLWIAAKVRPQILHLPITSFWAFWKDAVFILLARALRLRVVAHLHGGRFETYYRESAPLVRKVIRWVLHQPDTLVALSNQWKRFLLELGAELEVEVVSNTIDPLFVPCIDQPRGRSTEGAMVLFVGQLGQHKGVLDILRSVPLVTQHRPDVCFVFAGLPETKKGWVEIREHCSGLNGGVQFLGQVTGKTKLDLFLRADIFILPSYAENLPYSVLEAMAVGLPVISTPVGAIPEIVEEGMNGFLITPGDSQALAEKILLLLENPALYAAVSQANRKKIKESYLPEVAMSHFDHIYSKLLGNFRSPH